MIEPTRPKDAIPLKVLICDAQASAIGALERGLSESSDVLAVSSAVSVTEARSAIQRDEYNTIFIDPLSLGLDQASEFVFETRRALPELVFVLYVDRAEAERRRAEFFAANVSASLTITRSTNRHR